jgi:aspartate/methionine/tyrosine aminotransferase
VVVQALCEAGDRVLVPRPSYPLLDYLAALEHVDLAFYPAIRGTMAGRPEALTAAVGERTRA